MNKKLLYLLSLIMFFLSAIALIGFFIVAASSRAALRNLIPSYMGFVIDLSTMPALRTTIIILGISETWRFLIKPRKFLSATSGLILIMIGIFMPQIVAFLKNINI